MPRLFFRDVVRQPDEARQLPGGARLHARRQEVEGGLRGRARHGRDEVHGRDGARRRRRRVRRPRVLEAEEAPQEARRQDLPRAVALLLLRRRPHRPVPLAARVREEPGARGRVGPPVVPEVRAAGRDGAVGQVELAADAHPGHGELLRDDGPAREVVGVDVERLRRVVVDVVGGAAPVRVRAVRVAVHRQAQDHVGAPQRGDLLRERLDVQELARVDEGHVLGDVAAQRAARVQRREAAAEALPGRELLLELDLAGRRHGQEPARRVELEAPALEAPPARLVRRLAGARVDGAGHGAHEADAHDRQGVELGPRAVGDGDGHAAARGDERLRGAAHRRRVFALWQNVFEPSSRTPVEPN